jgi:signal transduction histidine kinase/ABC-type branched-subunit amino acid transport system ATPase component
MASPTPKSSVDLLALRGLSFAYGHVPALKNIHLTLGYAAVHAVVGEHGAGKSSLGLLLNGMLQPQAGQIWFAGRAYAAFTMPLALKLGIHMIYQQAQLYEQFTVAENLFLTNPRVNRFAWRSKARFVNAARDLLALYNFDLDPAAPIQNLNVSDQTIVELLKHLHLRPKLLILDEVFERLAAPAQHKVRPLLLELKQTGTSFLFITHRIDDIYTLADHVSILKNGEILVTDDVRNLDKLNLIKMAYTQIAAEDRNVDNLNQEFYHLLKYNEAILRNLPVNLIVTDNDHQIKLVNEHCKQHFQLTSAAYLNRPLDDLLAGPNAEARQQIKAALAAAESQTIYQLPLTLNDRHTINNLKTFPIYDGEYRIGNILTIEDVTEYDHLQQQLLLSEKLASVGLLAAGVAHEINNPLEIIYNYLSYLKYNVQGAELQAAIGYIHNEITSITNIVSNLHAFSDHRQRLTPEEIDLHDLIATMLTLLQHHARHKQIQIDFVPAAGHLMIWAHKNEIKQVLLNLFKNSFEAMPTGGVIQITTAAVNIADKTCAEIRFRDTGPGISADKLSDIFLPFYSTKQGQEHNMGLGLAVSYGIIKKYQGTITVANLNAGGCEFVIQLPLAPATDQ